MLLWCLQVVFTSISQANKLAGPIAAGDLQKTSNRHMIVTGATPTLRCPVHNTSGDQLGTAGVSIQNTYRLHSNRSRCHCKQRRSGGSAMRLTVKQDPNIPHSPVYTSNQRWPVSLIAPLNGCVCEWGVRRTGRGGGYQLRAKNLDDGRNFLLST